MEIFLWILGSCLFYTVGVGYTIRFVNNNTNWHMDNIIISSALAWPFILSGVLSYTVQRSLETWWKHRKELASHKRTLKALPSIHVKKGAKIEEFKQYKRLKTMCSNFEIENDLDRILEE
jgi:phosphate/sulfate permease